MTCRDCKNRHACTEPNKSYKYDKDGDNLANWCDDFDTKHKDKTVVKDGLRIKQSGYSFNVWVSDEKTGELISHFLCCKKKSKRKLKRYAGYVKNTLSKLGVFENEVSKK